MLAMILQSQKCSGRLAGLCAWARASCACGREIRLTPRRQGAKHESLPKKSATAQRRAGGSCQQRCEVVRPRLRRRFCCKPASVCRQIRQSLARQVPLGAAEKVKSSVLAQRVSLVGQRARRRRALARKPGCQRLPPGRCPGSGLHPPLGRAQKVSGRGPAGEAVSSATLRSCLASAASRSLLQSCSGVPQNSPHAKSPSRKVLKSKKGCKSNAAKPKIRVRLRPSASYFHSLPGVFSKASRSQPSFQPLFFVQRQVCAHAVG